MQVFCFFYLYRFLEIIPYLGLYITLCQEWWWFCPRWIYVWVDCGSLINFIQQIESNVIYPIVVQNFLIFTACCYWAYCGFRLVDFRNITRPYLCMVVCAHGIFVQCTQTQNYCSEKISSGECLTKAFCISQVLYFIPMQIYTLGMLTQWQVWGYFWRATTGHWGANLFSHRLRWKYE